MFESYSDKPVYNVKAVVSQSGVMASTLRAWERRYGVPEPQRNDNGYRLYSARDIARVRWLKTKLDAGMSISQAVSLLKTETEREPGSSGSIEALIATGSDSRQSDAGFEPFHRAILARAQHFDESGIESTLSQAFSLFSVEDVCLKVLQPVLVALGEGWHRGTINVSTEHFMTNLARRKLLALIGACAPPSRPERLVIGCAPEEFHEVGCLMLALFLRRRGFDVIYLGQNIADTQLDEMIESIGPAMLILTSTTFQSAIRLLDVVEQLSASATHANSARPFVLAYGGIVFQHAPELRAHIPAVYLGDDIREGVARAIVLLNDALPQSNPVVEVDARWVAAAREFGLHKAEITMRVAQRLFANDASGATDHERVFELNRQLMTAIEVALRYGEAGLVRNSMTWLTASQIALPAEAEAWPARYLAVYRQAANELLPARTAATVNVLLMACESGQNIPQTLRDP
jgi:MerR family transcriptional regulator, light-induced transcriptional regulator